MNPATIVIRKPDGADDWLQVNTLLRAYVDWIRSATDFDPFVEQPGLMVELDDAARHYTRSEQRTLLVAFVDDAAVGTLAVSLHPGGQAELKRMFVRPETRGLGIADRLIRAGMRFAQVHRCSDVWLETVPGAMDRAIALYRRHGFRVTNERRPTLHVDGAVMMQRWVGRGPRSPQPHPRAVAHTRSTGHQRAERAGRRTRLGARITRC